MEDFYERNFEFVETDAFNSKFNAMGFDSKNFLMNSGSIMVFIIMVFVTFMFQKVCNRIAIYFHRYSIWR
jgi:hypothetical protein